MRAGAAAEVGGGPGRGVRPRHPGLEEEESILQPGERMGRGQCRTEEVSACPEGCAARWLRTRVQGHPDLGSIPSSATDLTCVFRQET